MIAATTELEEQIEQLGAWAAGLELSAQDPTSPYWMRQQDAERAQRIRYEHMKLMEQHELAMQGFHKCETDGCPTMVIGSDFCPRCEEDNQQGYIFGNLLLGETFGQYVARIWRGFWPRKAEQEAQS